MKPAIITSIIAIFVNLIILDYYIFSKQMDMEMKDEEAFSVVSLKEKPEAESALPTPQVVDSCYPYSCVDLIREATASLSPKPGAKVVQAVTTYGKEYYITLGSGKTKSDVWEDVTGLSAYIDSTKYGKIKKVTFEASMWIENAHGRFYAQLYNATDDHPVWFSEISMEGDKPQLLISEPIALDKGNKLYKVQVKTTIKEVSHIDQARVHILSE